MDLFEVVLTDSHRCYGPYRIFSKNKKDAYLTSCILARRPVSSGGAGVPVNQTLLLATDVEVLRPVLSF